MDPTQLTLIQLGQIAGTFVGPQTRRITDYLRGYQLGPERAYVTLIQPDGTVREFDAGESVSYWSGDLLPQNDPRYSRQVAALKKSFNSRNLTLEGVELLADGVGVDEPDWGWTVARPLADDEQPTESEAALIAELEGILTAWWDARSIPGLLESALVPALAHGRQPIRPRIPPRFLTPEGRLQQRPAAQSLDGFFVTLPDVGDSGIYTDGDMDRYGLTRVILDTPAGPRYGWELTYTDPDGHTRVRTLNDQGVGSESGNLDLGGLLWLLELRFRRGVVTPDVLSNQDALNVGLTSLSRNTRWAAFEKTIMLGVEPPLDEDGRVKPLNGPGSEAYLQPSVSTEVETTTADGVTNEIRRERPYAGASATKLDPAEPQAIQAAISQAEANIYGILRQQFMLMGADATASGRSREVATGSYLRAVARYAATVEALIRDLLTLAARVSAIVQGQPGRYDGLRPVVTCRQKVFEPSAESVTAYQALQMGGVISMQTLRGMVGVADPDAEQDQIDREKAAAPTPAPIPPSDPPPPAT